MPSIPQTPQNTLPRRWFQHTWGIIIIFGLIAIGGLLLILVGTTLKYWWLIKQGKGDLVLAKIQTHGFSVAIKDKPNSKIIANRADLEIDSAPFLGRERAPVTIVVFMDYKCDHSKATLPILQQLAQSYGNKIKIIFRHFPAESIRPGTTQLSEIAYCAQSQGAFWPMSKLLFDEQNNLPSPLSTSDIQGLANTFGIDGQKLATCASSIRTAQAVRTDFMSGFVAGIRGTPTFFVNGTKIEGVVPLETWKKVIDSITN